VEEQLGAFKNFYASYKTGNLAHAARENTSLLITNINNHRDLNAGVSPAGYGALVKYLAEQEAKAETVFGKLVNQFQAGVLLPATVSKTASLESMKQVINISLPNIEIELYNGLALDQEAAHIISGSLDAVRSEWNRVNTAEKLNLLNSRQAQYLENINVRRSLNYGIKDSELKDAVAWEKRQQEISRPLFASFLRSCALNQETLPESAAVNPGVTAIDISPLAIEAVYCNGIALDSTLAGGVENMAGILPKTMETQLNVETKKTVNRQMDRFLKNGADWAEFRYKILTGLSLKAAEFVEAARGFFSRDYQKKDVEGAWYMSYMSRDFQLEKELLQDLEWAVQWDKELFNALLGDFNDCVLKDGGAYTFTGDTSREKIRDAALAVPDYINKVFPELLNTGVNVRFVEKDEMDGLWGPVLGIEIAVGCIPGVGLVADLVIDTCIEVAAALVEKNLKQDEYAAKIAEMVNGERQKLLFIVNKPIYGGSR
jgi:hypothetical protein